MTLQFERDKENIVYMMELLRKSKFQVFLAHNLVETLNRWSEYRLGRPLPVEGLSTLRLDYELAYKVINEAHRNILARTLGLHE